MFTKETSFWDSRYHSEGMIWSDGPSSTAQIALRHVLPGMNVLDVGCGYGRDLKFFQDRNCSVTGIDSSHVAAQLLSQESVGDLKTQNQIIVGSFEDHAFLNSEFDLVNCHRVFHLLVDTFAVTKFVSQVDRITKPGGVLCIGTRDARDFDPLTMKLIDEHVVEYINRPGHHIRFWSELDLSAIFGTRFDILEFSQVQELESTSNPIPCHLTVMVARKNAR